MYQKSLKYISILFLGASMSLHAQEETTKATKDATETIPTDDLGIKTYTLGEITISGNIHYNPMTIQTFTGLQKGQTIHLPGDELSDAIKKLWNLEYFSNIKIYEKKLDGNVLDIEIYLEELPRLKDVEIIGLRKSKKEEILKELKFATEETYGKNNKKRLKIIEGKIINENLIANTKNFLLNKYKKNGFYNAQINIKTIISPTNKKEANLIIEINRGKKVRIEKINFEGNNNIADRKLKKAMKKTKQRNIFNPLRIFTPSKFIANEYEKDLDHLIDAYKENGFRDARVVKEKATYNPDTNRMNIDITIEEGKKYFIGDLRFIGNKAYSDYQLKRVLGFEKGDLYNGVLLNKRVNDINDPDGNNIGNLYQNNGYLFSRVNLIERQTKNDTIDFDIRVYEGNIARFNNISVKGNDKTKDYIILRELSTIPGQKWDRSNVFESIRRLQSMNIFDAQQIIPDVKNADQVNSTVDVEWQVVEHGQSQVEIQGGYGGRTFIGTLALSFNNFSIRNIFNKKAYTPFPMGDAQKFSIRAQASTFFRTLSASFQEPWFGGRKPISLFGSVSYSAQSFYDYYTYKIDRSQGLDITSVNFGIAKRLPDPIFTLSHSLNYQNYDLKNYNLSYLAFNNGNSKNMAYSIELTRDNRGGLHPAIFPSTGSVMSISGKFTFPYSLVNGVDYANLENQKEYKTITTQLISHPITGADIPVGTYLDSNGLPVEDYRDAAPNQTKIDQKRFNWLEYYKINFKADWYTLIVDKLVLRSTGQFGFLGAYNQSRGLIPFERYYLGGSGMMNFTLDGRENIALRGYEDNQLNQKNTNGSPIGGTVYNKFSLELRYPITLKAQMSAFVLGFFDAGSVYNDFKTYKPFQLQRSAGAGVRVFMPMIGLLGLDFGYGFDNVPGTNRLGGWQTHFILGQQF